MIRINDVIEISEGEIQLDFVRGSGPGGQNVNKVASAVQLRFDVTKSTSLPPEVKERLLESARKQVTGEGILIIDARRFRSQEANRQDAIQRLVKLIFRSAQKPVIRRKTRPTTASKTRRLDTKRRRSRIKQTRRKVPGNDE